MKEGCDKDPVDALVRGELSAERAAVVEAHAAACTSCTEELAWLRAERRMFASRAAATPLPAQLWAGIERRAAAAATRANERRRVWLQRGAVAGFVAAAAAVIVIAWRSQSLKEHETASVDTAPAPASVSKFTPLDPDFLLGPDLEAAPAEQVLHDAENDVEAAIVTLEADYAVVRPRLDPAVAEQDDVQLAAMREAMSEAQTQAGDVASKERLVHTTAAYMRLLQRAVLADSPVAELDGERKGSR